MKTPRLLHSDRREIWAETILFLLIAAVSVWPMICAIDAIMQVT